ncbi:hypothetical protein CTM97_00580 [Photobacterium phosphoreum]|uniref:Uncharacterized protein n=1 Tax=Photobacterium phosphoreum TaxID=659 RepID=A0A2T3JKV6_PHOPO|nr:hypothetical protein [Photobacterium phosphoreum]PSU24474.1 hypothetical protein CTM96_12580 [Photobacterium phosphoreum]PSU44394.1 hypothetical protein CTM97_00580 [Photobacterium phosphoreum]PSU49654.1 hypothetical protein C9J18_15670 [Photobacterium phosphoreum]
MIRTKITPPQNLCIYNAAFHIETYDFFEKINIAVFTRHELVTIDLTSVKIITAAASVLLFATVSTCQLSMNNANQIRCIFPRSDKNETGHRYIVKTGLARALHSGSVDKLELLTKDQIYFQTSTDPSLHLLSTFNLLTKEMAFTPVLLQLLVTGVSEAMLNVIHHAYKDPFNAAFIHSTKKLIVAGIGERWWQCAWFDSRKKAWIFIICDIGLGIPQTYNYLRQDHLYSVNPSLALKHAFIRGNSRFIGSGRGNGSEDMMQPIKSGYNESLLVYSGGAKYHFKTGMDQPEIENLSRFFNGTLVEWTLYVSNEEEI